ncbi:MAG: DUF1499 domain-containing protein [Aquabacterium sp.]
MTALTVLIAAIILVLLGARLGLFNGPAPRNLGVRDGRLKPPAKTPNSVASQAALHQDHPMARHAAIDPLPMRGDAAASIAALAPLVQAMPGAEIVRQEGDYLYATFQTALMRFKDDAEFWADPTQGVIHLRSASRVGRKDFGVNRARIEALRDRWTRTS